MRTGLLLVLTCGRDSIPSAAMRSMVQAPVLTGLLTEKKTSCKQNGSHNSTSPDKGVLIDELEGEKTYVSHVSAERSVRACHVFFRASTDSGSLRHNSRQFGCRRSCSQAG